MAPISSAMEFALEELVMRLSKSDDKLETLRTQLKNHRAGKAGEKRVLEAVHSVGLPEECEVLADLNLRLASGWEFQVDILLVMPAVFSCLNQNKSAADSNSAAGLLR